jgi:cytochrome c oxidase subunit 3
MATTLQPPQTEKARELRPRGGNGAGGVQGPPTGGELRNLADRPGETARTGIWVALAAIGMTFAALTSALYVREGAATDWQHIALPGVLWFNTLALIASSVTLEIARRRVSAYMRERGTDRSSSTFWLNATLALGVVFVIGQYMAWLKLRSEGLYLPTNPNSSFFYVFTGVHAVHVLGGLGGLTRLVVKFRNRSLRRSTMDATSYYWHFMGALWLYLMFILWVKL